MKNRRVPKFFIALFVATMCVASSPVFAATAVFAGGCFWCVEKDFESLAGVTKAISGFTGGAIKNPTYNGNHDGHYEAVEIHYDPDVVSYEELLEHFWVNIDPFDARGQFCDKGHEYLSAIFVSDDLQQTLAEASKEAVAKRFADKQIATRIFPLTTFYPIKGAESYHQDFYKKSPVRYKAYRYACGRDRRLQRIWGKDATV